MKLVAAVIKLIQQVNRLKRNELAAAPTAPPATPEDEIGRAHV